MHDTRLDQANASTGFVQHVERYLHRCLQRIQAQDERRGAGPDPRGPGRPLDLPKVVLWSSLLLSVLQGARSVREVWRRVVLAGYDICDQTLYDRLEQEGPAWLERCFGQITAMVAAWLTPLLARQPWFALASFASDVLAQDDLPLTLVNVMHAQAVDFDVTRLVRKAGQSGETLVRRANYGHTMLLLTHYLGGSLGGVDDLLAEVRHDFFRHHFLEFQDEVIR
jgi:hypothetical protein